MIIDIILTIISNIIEPITAFINNPLTPGRVILKCPNSIVLNIAPATPVIKLLSMPRPRPLVIMPAAHPAISPTINSITIV